MVSSNKSFSLFVLLASLFCELEWDFDEEEYFRL